VDLGVALSVCFRLFLIAFHGYLGIRMLLHLRETIPRISELEQRDTLSGPEFKAQRLAYHSRQRKIAWVAAALQVWGAPSQDPGARRERSVDSHRPHPQADRTLLNRGGGK
jgi:hypothetical protein